VPSLGVRGTNGAVRLLPRWAYMKHRPDIDGLRALAVIPVVLYHAGVPGLSGGFVGVDVFFVISGFLITTILVRDLEDPTRRFSLADFYVRRIRRIFPALLTVLAVTALLATYILLPRDFDDLSKSLVAAALFASNIFFYRQAGYFDTDAHSKPLLHTWSLAVEEQFYLVFPLLLLVLYRVGWRRLGLRRTLLSLTAVSFAWSLWQLRSAPSAAFYLAPARGWELLLGALIAVGTFPPLRRGVAEGAALLGVALLAAGYVLITPQSQFPGLLALLPCLGAALVIHAGSATVVNRALSRAPFVAIGAMSYGLYLWHWPLLVLGRHWSLAPLSPLQTAAIVGVAVALSLLSLRYIEAPFRVARVAGHGTGAATHRAVFAWGALASSAVIVIGLLGTRSGGWPSRIPSAAIAFDAAQRDVNVRRAECHAHDANPVPYRDSCRFGASGATPRVVIWSDSHGVELAVALGEMVARTGASVRLVSYSACPPGSVRGGARGGTDGCTIHDRNARAAIAADTSVRVVILIARYNQAVRDQGARYFEELATVADGLDAAGKHVVLAYPAPEYAFVVPTQLARTVLRGRSTADVGLARGDFEQQRASIVHALDAIRARSTVSAIDLAERLCTATRCRTESDGRALYFDDDHLSVSGARFVSPAFALVLSAGSGTEVALNSGILSP